jgi:hypothetical protein
MPQIATWTGLLMVGWVAAEAILATAVLPAMARNKVEGVALTKLTNLAAFVPLIAFLPSSWRFLAGPVPTYWIGEMLRGPSPLVGIIGTIVHALAVVLALVLVSRSTG